MREMKILIVEDNPQMRQLIRAVVADLAEAITECADGEEAVAAYAAQQLGEEDRVLMDLQMPGVGGLEATRRIRSLPDPRRRRTPIVAMSAHVFRDEIDRHLAAGMDAFLGKPTEE